MTYDDQNIFAKILRGEIPCETLFEDEHVLAFMDIMPQVDGHCLVVPKKPSIGLLDADPDCIGPTFYCRSTAEQGRNQGLSCGWGDHYAVQRECCGQTVFHLHVHVMPRMAGIPPRPHTGKMEAPEIIQKNAALIRAALI